VNASTRLAVYQRAGGVCENPGCRAELKPVGPDQYHVDHIYPYSLAPNDPDIETMANLQALCRTCNLKKGDRFVDFTGRSPWTAGRPSRQPVRRRRLPQLAAAIALASIPLVGLVHWHEAISGHDVSAAVDTATSEAMTWVANSGTALTALGDQLIDQSPLTWPHAGSPAAGPDRVRDSLGSWLEANGQTAGTVTVAASAMWLLRRTARAFSRRQP
jgi:hypothetical protein